VVRFAALVTVTAAIPVWATVPGDTRLVDDGRLYAMSADDGNTHQFFEGPIKKSNVHRLEMQWFHETTVASPLDALDGEIDGIFKSLLGDMPIENTGPVPAAPAVDGDDIYFNDSSGFITKLNRFTGGWERRDGRRATRSSSPS
jgi:hypothetical protein